MNFLKFIKHIFTFLLTFLLGTQTTYAKNKLLLPKTKVSFLIENNAKNIFDATITLDIQLKNAASVRIRSTLLEELKDSNNKTVYRIVFVNDKKSLTNLTNTLTNNRKKVLNALKNGDIKNVVAKGNNAAEHLNINGKTIDIVDAEIRSLDVNGKIISKKVAGKLAKAGSDIFNCFSKAIDFGGDIIKRTNKKLNILGRVNPKNGTIGTSKLRTELIAKGVPETELTALLTPMPSSWNNMSVIGMNTKYWNDINKLHIDDIIANGGDIRFIQDPRLAANQFNRVSDMLSGPFKTKCINEGLVKIKTFMKMEYDYLVSKGYILQADGLMIKP